MTYALLDSGNFKKLEQFGSVIIERPAASAPWLPQSSKPWKAHAVFTRTKGGDGEWKNTGKIPEKWVVENEGIKLNIKLTDFGHVGMFPEHHGLRAFFKQPSGGTPLKLLNLFAYTGFVSLLAAQEGWAVSHVDASKSSITWARDNAQLNGLKDAPIFWYCDDVMKFVQKEIKRQKRYDAIVLDPPSYGRGPGGELWKIEEDLVPLLGMLKELLSPNFKFLQLSAHTPGLTSMALENLLTTAFMDKQSQAKNSLLLHSEEMSVKESKRPLQMPVGACARLVTSPLLNKPGL